MSDVDTQTEEQVVVATSVSVADFETAYDWANERLADMQRLLNEANMSLTLKTARLESSRADVQELSVALEHLQRDVRRANDTIGRVSNRLYDEIEVGTRKETLLRALMVSLATESIPRAVDIVRRGAEIAQLDSQVVLDEFDRVFRAEIVDKAVRDEELQAVARYRDAVGVGESGWGFLSQMAEALGLDFSVDGPDRR